MEEEEEKKNNTTKETKRFYKLFECSIDTHKMLVLHNVYNCEVKQIVFEHNILGLGKGELVAASVLQAEIFEVKDTQKKR